MAERRSSVLNMGGRMTNVVCPDCGPARSCAPSSSSYFRSEGRLIRRFGRMVRLHTGRSICLYGAFPADGPCPPRPAGKSASRPKSPGPKPVSRGGGANFLSPVVSAPTGGYSLLHNPLSGPSWTGRAEAEPLLVLTPTRTSRPVGIPVLGDASVIKSHNV